MIVREAIGIGSTVTAAMEDAINKLNASIDEEYVTEIVEQPKKKVLGIFGGSEAKVRAYIEKPDEKKPEAKSKTGDDRFKNDRKPDKKARPEKKEKQVPKVSAEASTEAPAGVPVSEIDPASPAGKAYKYLAGVLEKLDCKDINATVSEIEGGSKITLEGSEKLGVIIGRRGETLDALQYLASLVANEKGSGYYRIVIDIGNYREKREGTLEALARRTASQVLRTGRSRSLEPMNPYERRIIHTAIQNIEGVTSVSVGDGSGRRVVISPEGKPVRNYGPKNDRGGRQQRPSRPARNTESSESVKPKETDGMKLYGKLK